MGRIAEPIAGEGKFPAQKFHGVVARIIVAIEAQKRFGCRKRRAESGRTEQEKYDERENHPHGENLQSALVRARPAQHGDMITDRAKADVEIAGNLLLANAAFQRREDFFAEFARMAGKRLEASRKFWFAHGEG